MSTQVEQAESSRPHTHTTMVAAYSSDLRERIVRYYYQGETMREVANTFNISLGFVHHVVDLHRKYGQVTDPYTWSQRGHRILTFADEDYIRTLIERRPSIYLDEIQEKLLTKQEVYVSLATISQTLVWMQCSKKSLSCRAVERNEGLRNLWELEVAEFDDPEFFVFIDESAIDNRTVQRSGGWLLVGGRSVSCCTFLRGKRHSILPALSSDGIIALDIFEGSVNKERFLQFLCEQVVRPSSSLHWGRGVLTPNIGSPVKSISRETKRCHHG